MPEPYDFGLIVDEVGYGAGEIEQRRVVAGIFFDLTKRCRLRGFTLLKLYFRESPVVVTASMDECDFVT